MMRRLLESIGRALGGERFDVDEPVRGFVRLRLSSRVSRMNGMEVCAYLIDTVLVDAGFMHAREPLLRFLEAKPLSAICLTHHHEDHVGVSASLSRRNGCPVYLRNAGRRFEEGISPLRPYRLVWWGEPEPYTASEMPERIDTGGRVLQAVPIPGHSATHTALFDESTGVVLTGDLFVSGGVTAVMAHENPFDSVASLRRVAALEPRWMLTGHGIVLDRPVRALSRKARAIEEAASRVLELHARGVPVRRILRRLFLRGRARDRLFAAITGGEFSRANFVRACIRHGA